jgi:hypothetical protein
MPAVDILSASTLALISDGVVRHFAFTLNQSFLADNLGEIAAESGDL